MERKPEEIILDVIKNKIKENGAEWVGNNFNQVISSSDELDKILSSSIKEEKARIVRAKLDVQRGKLLEKILKLLLNSHFENCKGYEHIKVASKLSEIQKEQIKEIIKHISIKRIRTEAVKSIDRDLIVYSTLKTDRVFLISVKGTARERIGQFLSHLFIFDDRVLRVKYGCLYEYKKPKFKYAFVCFDLAENKDLSGEEINTQGTKQLEVYLIDDDNYISGGIYVLNNLPKLNKVGNFSELLARIKKFFDERI